MAMIYVRTRPGRRAFFEGKILPEDKFVPVPDNPYIRRLVRVWGDLEQQDAGDIKPTAVAAPERDKTAESGRSRRDN
jgi:hypothetical protein